MKEEVETWNYRMETTKEKEEVVGGGKGVAERSEEEELGEWKPMGYLYGLPKQGKISGKHNCG